MIGFYLTKIEKDFLYKKYINQGMLPYEANRRLNKNSEYLRELAMKLKRRGLDQKDINTQFKEAFSRLVENDSV